MGKHTSEHKNHAQIVQLLQDGHYFFHKGLKAYKERNLKRASKLIQRAVHLEPKDSEMLSQLAVIYSEMGQYQESNDLLDYILANLETEMPECHYFKANNFAHLGLFQEAYKEAAAYSDADPDGEFSEENDSLLDLLDLGDGGPEDSLYDQDELLIKQDRAKSLLESGQLAEAVAALEEITNEYPELWSAYNNLALAHFYSGNVVKAKQMAYQVLNNNEGNLHALCNLLVFFYYEREDEKVAELSDQLSNVYPMLFEQRYKLGATLSLVGRYDIGYKWLRSLYKSGFEGDDTFYYWLSCSAYFTGHTEFAETVWRKVESQYPGADRPAPWVERREVLPSSVEQRLAAYYISSTKGETEHLEAVIRSKRITAPFENHFVKLLLHGDSAAADVSEDALFAYQTVKLLEEAEEDEMKTEVMSCWVFHVIQQIRAAGPLKNVSGWAAAIYYIWREAHGKHDTKKETAAQFGISPATLTKYMKYIDDILE
ncbi:tetratricopeptide repeat protein [Bacillus mojavensis]|uniref:tetratricopeptide repeat protein n=1 Tax=Bacillus mojavensis TaxID=72360 RepID=UPI002DBE1F85|nr:tetratricopeptide repeat protein [Bacillus mojavensis]MEC1288822.1 tetratricopeptide repeat protein [Bacillus mojavensis]MEC1634525.1 tetratricopeptide repeat protein [Bacillus mojavensis]MEC1658303.1 tetratricopeptide repeat protein [Bacillus mojavensis]MEC1683931.1 tetratricopeptide repeat protein [Bacillus mojavensis]MEC1704008.1 tetratricopeptide repeat protein [Bacillus mojavensis]